MVVGAGMIARKFSEYENNASYLIFASGVSDSKCTDEEQYERETNLLSTVMKENPEKAVVYFSTCSVYDSAEVNSRYVQHKLYIEDKIAKEADRYLIFRASNVVGVTNNTKTVLNFFITQIKSQKSFQVWKNASRNLLDIDDLYIIADHFIKAGAMNQTINVASPVTYNVTDIVTAIEQHFNIKANYTLVDKGNKYQIPTEEVLSVLDKLPVTFSPDYLKNLLKKYF